MQLFLLCKISPQGYHHYSVREVSKKIGEAALSKVASEMLEEEEWKQELLSKTQHSKAAPAGTDSSGGTRDNSKLKKSKGKTKDKKKEQKGKSPPSRERATSDPGTRPKRSPTADRTLLYFFFKF